VPVVTAPVLTAERLWWRYRRGSWLLEELSLSVAAGELLRVRGGNGSGKSTLLRLLAGCVVPQRGSVTTAGRVGYLPQLARALPPVRAGRLLELVGGRSDPADLSLRAFLGTRADELSGGTARRLLLDAVLALPARVLVLDEPASGLDAEGVDRLAVVLRARLAAGVAVVVAEHRPLPLAGGAVVDLGGSAPADELVEIILGGQGTFRGTTAVGGRLVMAVTADDRDVLLVEALGAGWSVLAVGPRR
jgi:ABC-type transport system involved in cytochrome c biogenesis ATPase subunit